MNKQGKITILISVSIIIVAAVLICIYLSSGNENDSINNSDKNLRPKNKNVISRQIDSIIFTFGIKKEWIHNNEPSAKDSLSKDKNIKSRINQQLISKEVFIPMDLPVIDLNHEISGYLKINDLSETVIEDPKSKNLLINIFSETDSNKQPAGNLKFIYSDSVKRNAAKVCIVFDSIDYYNFNDVERMLVSTQEFSVFLPLRNDKADFQSSVTGAKRDYLIKLIIGNEDDIEADFKSDMKESLVRSKIRTLYLNFPQTSGIILNGRNNLKEFENKIREEFEKNNMKVYQDTVFAEVRRGDDIVASLFKDIVNRSNSGKKILFYIVNFSPENFNEYDNQVYALKKKGFKFYNFKELSGIAGY